MKHLTSLLLAIMWAVPAFAQALFPLPNAEGKWGYVDAQKNLKIEYQFLGASPFHDERAFISRKVAPNEEPIISVIDPAGKVLFDVNFVNHEVDRLCQMFVHRYSEGLLFAPNGGGARTYRYLDKAGKPVLSIPHKAENWASATPFSEGLAFVHLSDTHWAYIDKTGKVVLKGENFMSPVERDFASGWAVDFRNKHTYIDKAGKEANFLKRFPGLLDLSPMYGGYGFITLPNPKDANLEPANYILTPDGKTKPVALELEHSTPVTHVSGYKFSNGLALVRYFVRKNNEIIGNAQNYINTEGKLAFELPAALTPCSFKNDEGGTYLGSQTGAEFHQGLACWVVQMGETKYKIVYITPAGKLAFESPVFSTGY